MPLSEDDQRRFDEIERALYQDDPRFAAGQSIDRLRRRRAITSVAAFLVGTVLLVVGLVATSAVLWLGVVISVTGSLIMVTVAAVFIRRHHV